MISKEVIPTETLKREKDALDFSILLRKQNFYLAVLHQLLLKQTIKGVLVKFSPTSSSWSLLFPSLLCLQGKGRRDILGTGLSFYYFGQKWVGDWIKILRMGEVGNHFPVTGLWAYGDVPLYGLAISHVNIIAKNGVTFLRGLLQWGHIIFWTFGWKESGFSLRNEVAGE